MSHRQALVLLSFVIFLVSCGPEATTPETTGPAAAPPVVAGSPAAEQPPLLSRALLFGNPQRSAGQLSHDGRLVGYVAPRDGVMNVYVASSSEPNAGRPITNDRLRGIRGFSFAFTNNHVLFSQDVGGDENFQVFAVDLMTNTQTALTPAGARGGISVLSPQRPNEIIVVMNDRDPRYFDPVRVDLVSGEHERLYENNEFASLYLDNNFALRYGVQQTADGGQEIFIREGDGWSSWLTIPQADALTTAIVGMTADGNTLYMIDSRERDTAALFAIDMASGTRRLLHEDARADVNNVLRHPATGEIQAVAVDYLRSEWTVLDQSIAADLQRLESIGEGDVLVTTRTQADDKWVVILTSSTNAPRVFLYDRSSGSVNHWYDPRPELANVVTAPMHTAEVSSRDGLTLPAYYTLPAGSDPDADGKPTTPVPAVLLVHGGPWGRDGYGFSSTHQWLANRGYAVISVNFRGSTGFGKAFTNAGDLEWGRKMHDDLIDGVEWAIGAGIAQRDKVAIMGGSYGGYATLAGLTMTPTAFACGVDIVGPSNLVTLLSTIPPYWGPIRTQFATRVGDETTEEGRKLLIERSPLTYADRIQRPLLIGQGANDPRVKQAESDQIVQAMQSRNIPVTYVLYPDEGHGFARPPNNMSFNAAAEEFLATCLGGRSQPVGDDLQGSSITVPIGGELLPGLQQALNAR